MMRKVVPALTLAACLVACSAGQPPAPAAQPTPAQADGAIVAEATVVPAHYAALSFLVGGTLEQVSVREGDSVGAGDVIARLNSDEAKANLARAEAQLKSAEARLQDLIDGPRAEDIAVAEVQLRQAQAQLKQIAESVTAEDIRSAREQIAAAQATLARLKPGAASADVRAAEAQVNQAQANLSSQRNQLSAAKTSAELQLRQAADALVQAQTAYSAAKWNWEHVQAHGTDPLSPSVPDASQPGQTRANELNETQKQQYHDAFVQAERGLHSAELAVRQAEVSLDNAQQLEIDGLQAAEASVAGAQSGLERTMSSVLTEQLAQGQAQLAQAQAQLARLRGPQHANQVAAAQAGVEVAQASLARITAPPQPSELTALEALVDSARAERDAARIALEHTELKAPFAGQIAALELRPGESISPSTAVAQLADTSEWYIETTDLTELDVARVRTGDRAELTFDALPDLHLTGQVASIRSYGEKLQGDVVYRAIIQLGKLDARLRWNMTVSAAILPSAMTSIHAADGTGDQPLRPGGRAVRNLG
jgi:HlyD family secretion protein